MSVRSGYIWPELPYPARIFAALGFRTPLVEVDGLRTTSRFTAADGVGTLGATETCFLPLFGYGFCLQRHPSTTVSFVNLALGIAVKESVRERWTPLRITVTVRETTRVSSADWGGRSLSL
jgi:hypothetical protein